MVIVKIKKCIGAIKKIAKRIMSQPKWHNLRSVEPISRKWGMERGLPVARIYIEHFLEKNKRFAKGVLCEIGDNRYSKQFGTNVKKIEILDIINYDSQATIVGDLTKIDGLPHNNLDCFILTQTLNAIYDFKEAIKGIHYMLKDGGVALVTVPGISQIDSGGMVRWMEYWRFTDVSIKKAFDEVFGKENVEVDTYGNVLSAISFLEGITGEELTKEELFFKDDDYQVTIAIKAIKRK